MGATPLTVAVAQDGEPLRAGTVTFAPAGQHLLVGPGGRCYLSGSPPLRFVRPSADLLFASAAATCGARSIGVVLTGGGADGAIGAKLIHQAGGVVIAQDPASASAAHPSMPHAAITTGCVDLVLPLAKIPKALISFLHPNPDPAPLKGAGGQPDPGPARRAVSPQ